MSRLPVALLLLACASAASADRLFADGYEVPVLAPLFPRSGATFALPPGPTADQIAWFMSELASGETTTPEEVAAHFDPSWPVSVGDTINFLAAVRASYPDAVITDVIGLTPIRATLVIDTPGSGEPSGFVVFGTTYGGGRIVQLGVSGFSGSVQYLEDRSLDMQQAADKFETLSPSPALLVGRIGRDGHCTAIVDRHADELRATASIFKLWVLGGAASGIADGAFDESTPITLDASAVVPGSDYGSEPLGTVAPLLDIATLMIGISDNTATDLTHHFVGRPRIDAFIDRSGVAEPTVLKPLLDITEQFQLFQSFPLDVALTYVNGTEAFQQQFIDEQIDPLGPLPGGSYNNVELFTSGSWRASPDDICEVFARHLRLPQGSDAADLVNRALGAQAAQPGVRNAWDRVWYKGGNLASAAGDHVLTHAWLLQDSGEDPFVVVAMSNNPDGGIDEYKVQSITSRILELTAQLPR
jgi:hypothetical protein